MECVDYLIEVAGGDCDRVAALLTAFLQKEVRVPFKIISNAGTTIHISTGTAGFGEALAWVFVNRPIGATVTFRTSASASGAVNTDAVAFVAPSPSVEADLDGVQVVTTGQAIPSQCIDLFHLHCHFDEATEAAAQRLLGSTITAIEEGGERACHSHVWHERNGPHVGWSWELWVDNPSALGLGVRHMLLERSGLDPRLRCMVHCDTDQEFTDHGVRCAFIGPPDALDVHFFRPPQKGQYFGPQGPRRTNAHVIQTMGETYDRATLAQVYPGKPSQSPVQSSETPHNGPGRPAVAHCTAHATVRPASASVELPTLPSLFLPHGSPPLPIERCACESWLQKAAAALPVRPRAIVFMSPHFRSIAPAFSVSTAKRPQTLYDFDSDTNPVAREKLEQLTYPCPGAPDVARRVAALLRAAGLECEEDPDQGLDHGVWTPLHVMFPSADVPVTSVSVLTDIDPALHMAAGRALRPLLDEGILIVGSGEVVHNVPQMGPRSSVPQPWCHGFEDWVESTARVATETVSATTAATTTTLLRQVSPPPMQSQEEQQRTEATLVEWRALAPFADIAHPKNGSPGEHFLPWFFAYGAGGGASSTARCLFKEYLGSLPMVAYSFQPRRDRIGPAAEPDVGKISRSVRTLASL